MTIDHQTFAVYGLGKAGFSTCRHLLELGHNVFAWDDSETGRSKLQPHPHLTIASPETYPWNSIDALILSPGIPFTHPAPHPIVLLAQRYGKPVICDIELYYRANPQALYIGITGTNGKSTTTTLTHHILKQTHASCQVGGNLGIPVLDLHPTKAGDPLVLELSSYQLDLIQQTHFNIACLLNLTPDHLDRHGDMEGYLKAKQRIFMNQTHTDTAVISVDDDYCKQTIALLNARQNAPKIIPISVVQPINGGVYCIDNTLIDDTDGKQTRYSIADRSRLPGTHNSQNIAFAYAMAKVAGITPQTIIDAVSTFGGLEHRIQYVSTISGVRFVNDSKATNAEATAKALVCYDDIYWIIGGRPKTGGITSLQSFFPRIRHAYLIGEAADEFAKTLGDSVPYTHCHTLDKAVSKAFEDAKIQQGAHPVVLLSPACASWDQFPNFEVRGHKFCDYVHALETARPS